MKSGYPHPVFRFCIIMTVFLICGFVLRYCYHAIPGAASLIAKSWFIDTFYRLLMGPVDFLLSLSGVPHQLGYSAAAGQYFIHLQKVNVDLFLWIPCLGISLMYVYTALILAFPNPWLKKLIFIVSGNLIIQLLNILRLFGLLLIIEHTHSTRATYFKLPWLAVNHETIFNGFVIFFIFLIFVIFTRNIKRNHPMNP